MTREEHIENLKAIASDMPSDKCSDWIESLMAGVKALEQASSSEKPNKWIPCSERLPETNDDVLVYDGVDMYVAWYQIKGMWQGWNSRDYNFERDTPIVAWMPLPEPYQPEIPTVAEGSEE